LGGYNGWPMCRYLNDVTIKYFAKFIFMGGALIFMLDNDPILNNVQIYKTKLVVIGFSQVVGVDYMDIFSLVVQIYFI
jgi:hypothetical protein